MKTTFWFWYGTQIVAAARTETLEQAWAKVTDESYATIACDRPYETPLDRHRRILHSTVKTYSPCEAGDPDCGGH